MATLFGNHDQVHFLRSLVELDYDAIEAYEAAIARLDDTTYRHQLQVFCDDHRRHIAELNPLIQQLGGEPVFEADIKRVLTKGKVILGSLIGDRQILQAMKSNEDDTNAAYERAVLRDDLGVQAIIILLRNLADERRHRAWLVRALDLGKAMYARPSSPSWT